MILNGKKARKSLANGAKKLAEVVGTTLGPKGRNVIAVAEKGATPIITNDGVTIAKLVRLENEAEKFGAEVILQASERTNKIAGDGTTSAIVLSNAIIKNGNKFVSRGVSPVVIKEELNRALEKSLLVLDFLATKIDGEEMLINITTASGGNEDNGKLVASVLSKVGANGHIIVCENDNGKTEVEITSGFEARAALVAPHFADDKAKMRTVYDDALVLISAEKIGEVREVIPALELARGQEKPLAIVAREFAPEVLQALLINKLKFGVAVCPIVLSATAEKIDAEIGDISAYTNANVFGKDNLKPISQVALEDFGRARVVCDLDKTLFICGAENEKILKRKQEITFQINESKDAFNRDGLKNRLARIEGKVATISVGAATLAERTEAKLRIDDAVAAGRVALENGVVAGGGATYLNISKKLGGSIGEKILKKSLSEITKLVLKNAGISPRKIIKILLKSAKTDLAYDARARRFGCMRDLALIDPKTVCEQVVRNAISASGILLTTEAIVS
ncbi:MAG: chaperonin GroEL [Christensenellaceae bacterium]|jgi:chaperonin GroEL|nr:chaperonin GroEL [Christensenellaceae bacterium]